MKFLHRVLPVPLSESECLWEERFGEEISDTRQQGCSPCASANPQWVKIYDPLGADVQKGGEKDVSQEVEEKKGEPRVRGLRLRCRAYVTATCKGTTTRKHVNVARFRMFVSSHIPPLL